MPFLNYFIKSSKFAGPLLILLLIGLLFGAYYFVVNMGKKPAQGDKTISTFEECISSTGSRIQESYPRVCVTSDGKRFVEKI